MTSRLFRIYLLAFGIGSVLAGGLSASKASELEFRECRTFSGVGSAQYFTPEFNDKDWGSSLMGLGAPGESFWLRCHAPSVQELSDSVLQLGRVADDDETYVNGVLVGTSLGKAPITRWNYFLPRAYYVGRELLRAQGENVVVIKANSAISARIGLVDGTPRISSEWLSAKPQGLDIISSLFLLFLTAVFLFYPTRTPPAAEMKRDFTYAGIMASTLQFMNSFYLYRAYPGYAVLWLKAHIIVTASCLFFLFRYSETLLGLRRRKHVFWVTIIFSAVALAIPGWTLSMGAIRTLGYLLAFWGVPTFFYGLFLIGCAFKRLRGERDIAILPYGMGAVMLALLGGWDLLQLSMGRLPVLIPASEIGFLIAQVMAAITLILRDNETLIGRLIFDATHWKTQHDSIAVEAAIGSSMRQVAHDIRSPLAAINALEKDLVILPEDTRLMLRSAVNRIQDIANKLIDKGREAKSVFKQEVVSSQLLSSLIDPLVSEKRLQFRTQIGVEIDARMAMNSYGLFAKVQPTEFKRVLSNLINNAVEALGEKGSVLLSLVAVNTGVNDEIEISVRDNGKGIALDILARLGQRGETHGKSEGSGLGLYHARTTAEAWGGRLKIESEVGKGTRVLITLPKAKAPDWFVSELKLIPGSTLVVLDDDTSIHQIWQGRFDSLRIAEQQMAAVHLSTPEQFRGWIRENAAVLGQTVFFADYELLGFRETGLSLIEEANLGSQSILVTSRFEEPQILEGCQRLKVRMIPKAMAGFIPISFGVAPAVFDAILIDDDELVHLTWKSVAKLRGKRLQGFFHPDEFFSRAETFSKLSPIYVDANLGHGIKGAEVAERIHKMGFAQVYLATGYEPEQFQHLKFLKAVVGKDPPF